MFKMEKNNKEKKKKQSFGLVFANKKTNEEQKQQN